MGLLKKTKIVGMKNAFTQYITVPSSMVQDSQYSFKNGENVNIFLEPEHQWLIVSRDDLEVSPKDFKPEENSEEIVIKKKGRRT